MAKRKSSKPGIVGTAWKKVTALIASILATAGTSGTVYFWDEITGKLHATKDGTTHPVAESVVEKLKEKAKEVIVDDGTLVPSLNCRTTDDGVTVRILSISPVSAAGRLGLAVGDVIESLDGKAINSPQELEIRIKDMSRFFGTILRIRRGETTLKGELIMTQENTLKVRRTVSN
ncbi:hypothetical protein BH11PLA2_BH11PLA2_16930 [soil metagenome]